MTEHKRLINSALKAIGMANKAILFSNSTGRGWMGKASRQKNGDIIIRNPRVLIAGLTTGAADLVGWRTIEITEDHVGLKIAQFVSAEAKAGADKLREEQEIWAKNVIDAGGLAFEFRSVDEALEKITAFF